MCQIITNFWPEVNYFCSLVDLTKTSINSIHANEQKRIPGYAYLLIIIVQCSMHFTNYKNKHNNPMWTFLQPQSCRHASACSWTAQTKTWCQSQNQERKHKLYYINYFLENSLAKLVLYWTFRKIKLIKHTNGLRWLE